MMELYRRLRKFNHRDERTWAWLADTVVGASPVASVTGTSDPKHILFVFELSAKVNTEPLLRNLADAMVVRLAVESPTTRWLR